MLIDFSQQLLPFLLNYLLASSLIFGFALLVLRFMPGRLAGMERVWLHSALLVALILPAAQVFVHGISRIQLPAVDSPVVVPSREASTEIEVEVMRNQSGFMPAPSDSPPIIYGAADEMSHGAHIVLALPGLLWLLVGGFRSLRYFEQRRQFFAALRREPLPAGPLQRWFRTLLQAHHRKPGSVKLSLSDAIQIPAAISSAEICLPHRFLSELQPQEQRAVISHELAHILRRDPLIYRAYDWLQIWLFFQPLQRNLIRKLQQAAEFEADEMAATMIAQRLAVARGLSAIAQWVMPAASIPSLARMAYSESLLVQRVQRLVNQVPIIRKDLGMKKRLIIMATFMAAGLAFIPGFEYSTNALYSQERGGYDYNRSAEVEQIDDNGTLKIKAKLSIRSDSRRLDARVKGKMIFAESRDRIECMTKGSYFQIEELRDDVWRRVRFEPADSTVTHKFYRNGKMVQANDAEDKWIEQILRECVRELNIFGDTPRRSRSVI